MQLEIVQIDELAAIATRDIFGVFQFVSSAQGARLTVPAVYKNRFFFRHACHFQTVLTL
jgi:hypothetical protein